MLLGIFFVCSRADEIGKQAVEITIPHKLDEQVISLVNLEKGEKIELQNSLSWVVNGEQYFFLPITFKKNQGCRLVFINATNLHLLGEDSDFAYPRCSISKKTEIIDLNHDGYLDFRIYVRIPHQIGSPVLVNHYFDFIYSSQLKMFCEQDRRAPCSYFEKK